MTGDIQANERPFAAAGILMIVSIIAVMAGQTYIGAVFDWEDKPFDAVFRMYRDRLPLIQVFWFIFAIGSMLLIPISLLLYSCFRNGRDELLRIGTGFGIIAGFSYGMGIMRWVLLADALSGSSAAAGIGAGSAEEIFHAFNVNAGNSFGETVAPLSHAAMAVCLGLAIIMNRDISDRITRVFAFLQTATGIGIALRPLEYVGLKTLGRFSDVLLVGWAVIFMGYGIYLVYRSFSEARIREQREDERKRINE